MYFAVLFQFQSNRVYKVHRYKQTMKGCFIFLPKLVYKNDGMESRNKLVLFPESKLSYYIFLDGICL